MIQKVLFLMLAIFYLIGNQSLVGQSIIRSSISSFGKSTSSDNIILHQTVGQSSNVNVAKSDDIFLRQGFQQPPFFSITERNIALVSAELYPNPNNGNFTLLVETQKNNNYNFQINDMVGASLAKGYGSSKEPLPLTYYLAAGLYIVNISQENQFIGFIKFIVY